MQAALITYWPLALLPFTCLYIVFDHINLSNPPVTFSFPCSQHTGSCSVAGPNVAPYFLPNQAWKTTAWHPHTQLKFKSLRTFTACGLTVRLESSMACAHSVQMNTPQHFSMFFQSKDSSVRKRKLRDLKGDLIRNKHLTEPSVTRSKWEITREIQYDRGRV